MMSNLNHPSRFDMTQQRPNANEPFSMPPRDNIRGLTVEPPPVRSIGSSAINSYRRDIGTRTVSGGDRSSHLLSPVEDPLFKYRIQSRMQPPINESSATK